MGEILLSSPSLETMHEYYDKLRTSGIGDGLVVQQHGSMGKGLFADRHFEENELILCEPPLVGAQHSFNKHEAIVCSFCFRYVGSIELQIKHIIQGRLHGHMCCEEEHDDANNDEYELLLNRDLCLPYADRFHLPPIVKCPGGCVEELFCSNVCAEAAWDAHHSLLCTGPNSLCADTEALRSFKQFADETNDIFHVASQVIANVMVESKRFRNKNNELSPTSALMEAWKPFAMGHKRLWWEAVSLPNDVDPAEEDSFRIQLKELAAESLRLLRSAIFDEEYACLFCLGLYGSIIGMFELNNLEIVVASPVEDYFLFIDDLNDKAKEEATKVTGAVLDALGEKYASFCRGSGFFRMQSCINHSCVPNAKAFKRDEDKNGNAVIVSTRAITKGEEILISYIDEEESIEERRSMLADYGFTCDCSKCNQQQAART